MRRRSDPRPRSDQIAASLRALIMSGDLAPGEQLPSILQLVKEHGVANTTIQRALTVLRAEGFIDSHAGRGVFVRDKQPFVVRVATYTAPVPGGFTHRLLEVSAAAPVPADVADGLCLARGVTAVLRRRVMLHEDEPVGLSQSYYPADLVAGTPLAGRAKISGGAPRALAELGYPQRRFTDRVSARVPTTEELLSLDLPDSTQVIRRLRVVYTDHDRPIEASVLINGAHLYELEYREIIEDR